MKPIMREFPFEFETERLTIRGPLPGDGTAVREAVLESQAELKRWMPWAVEVENEADYEARVREGHLRFLAREELWMLLFLQGTNIVVGASGLHRIDWDVPKVEIGYWVRTSYARQGYITEAVTGITAFAFETLGVARVEIRCDALNERSAAVAQRLAFPLEGILKNETRHHISHELRDTMVFAKVQDGTAI